MLPGGERAAVTSGFHTAMAVLPPAMAAAGRRLLARISTPNWTLEWMLPRWLGSALGIAPADFLELMLSNVYGLAYVRLYDDLLDGEVGELPLDQAAALLDTLYALWTSVYHGLFGQALRFWAYFDEYLAQWRRSSLPPAVPFRAFAAEDFLHLGHRGAPLKICCAGAGILAGREGIIPTLTTAIDGWLVAAVLLDHAHDWDVDLAQGRYNAFVAYVVDGPQTPDRLAENRRAMLEHLYLGDGSRDYHEQVRRHIAAARDAVSVLGCPELDAYLVSFEQEAFAYREGVAADARRRLRQVTEQLLGTANYHP